ncbi:helix-turn-helix domain-containing protein [Mesorhizobium sp. 1B3]|uniref:helix-turn-helix domain-containing protein n=1 Tax=Mesorhizobium sp. 1B3 TaxID=3243599 RepID=UPI003D99637F
MATMFDIRPTRDSDDFSVDVRSSHLGQMIFSTMRVDDFVFERPRRKIRSDLLDHFMLRFDLPTGNAAIGGELLVIDLGQPLETVPIARENISLILPRELMADVLPDVERLHGAARRSDMARLLGDYMRSLAQIVSSMEAAEATRIADATRHLVAACLGTSSDAVAEARPQIETVLLSRARRFIDANLGREELSPAGVAAACGLSRASLYRLFEPFGGVARYVLEQRLAEAFDTLADPAQTRQIALIAHDLGFSSESQFSRAFRRFYGMSPSDVRASARVAAAPSREHRRHPLETQEFGTWLRVLRS